MPKKTNPQGAGAKKNEAIAKRFNVLSHISLFVVVVVVVL